MSFIIEASCSMFQIKTIDSSLKWDGEELRVSFYDKMKLIFNIRPDLKLKRLVERGQDKLNTFFDLMYLMKTTHHSGQLLNKNSNNSY